MNSKCSDGKNFCKYRGDLPEICPKYCKGNNNGEPIIAWNEFPMLCKDCNDRDLYWCKSQSDLICFAEQDPFDCRKDLAKDTIWGEDLIKSNLKAIERARKKWGSPITKKEE
jgi:hypothetical protein